MVRGAFGVCSTGASRFLLSLIALLPSAALAINLLLQLAQPGQVCLAPQPHSPTVAYVQLGGLKLFGHHPAVQGHNGNTRCFCRLLRVTGLCHIRDIYNTFSVACKALF
jgi:hypothetical protein